MPGIRIRPQPKRLGDIGLSSAAGRLFVIRDRSRPLQASSDRPSCALCGVPHEFKTYHLQMDSEGATIVSETIWERLQGLIDHGGMEKVSDIEDPPTQRLGVGPRERHPDVIHGLGKD